LGIAQVEGANEYTVLGLAYVGLLFIALIDI
jgi:hypothetical protein